MKIIKSITRLLKGNNVFTALLFLSVTGCATSSYRIANKSGGQYELLTTPDRVLLKCENLETEDIVSYGFSIFVLDEKNTVLPVVQTNRIGKANCDKRVREIGKILKRGKSIYIAGIGDLEEPRKMLKASYLFSKHGTFQDNGRMLQFHAIANEHGDCFDAYSGSRKPCPQGHFPIEAP